MSEKSIPIREGLWTEPTRPGEKPGLIGSECLNCGELFFPKKENGICTNCQSSNLKEIRFSPRGRVYSHTVVMQRPPEYYQGQVPYALGFVELPEGIRIETLFTDCDFDRLEIGMEVEMVLEKLHEDAQGREVIAYKFRPVDC